MPPSSLVGGLASRKVSFSLSNAATAFSNLILVSCPNFSKTYSPSVFYIDGLKLYVFESLK